MNTIIENLIAWGSYAKEHLVESLVPFGIIFMAVWGFLTNKRRENRKEEAKAAVEIAKNELEVDKVTAQRRALDQSTLDSMLEQYKAMQVSISKAQAGEAQAIELKFKAKSELAKEQHERVAAELKAERLLEAIEQHVRDSPHCIINTNSQ